MRNGWARGLEWTRGLQSWWLDAVVGDEALWMRVIRRNSGGSDGLTGFDARLIIHRWKAGFAPALFRYYREASKSLYLKADSAN